MRILLVEDDASIVELLTAALAEQNYIIDVASDGEAGWDLVETYSYDLILLDIGLPGLDGISFCQRLRADNNSVLVLLLTARDTTTDRLLGLDSGADDYVVKPFNIQELAARIRALLRRGRTAGTPILICGRLQLDPRSCEVTYGEQLLRFSRKEYLILELFLRHPQQVFSRSAIIDRLWSSGEDPPNEDTIKSHIKNIRRELKTVGANDLIETLYGQGYRINPTYLTESPAELLTTQTSNRPEETLETIAAEIWELTKDRTLERVELLASSVQALAAETLDEERYLQARQTAHKLAGSLGTFGFNLGSQIARQIEEYFEPALNAQVQSALAVQVAPLVTALRQQLEQGPSPSSSELDSESLAINRLSSQQFSLLIVDMDSQAANRLVIAATGLNIQAAIAPDLESAQAQIQAIAPDVIVIDVELLTEANVARVAELQPQRPLPLIIIRGTRTSTRDRLLALRFGCQCFIPRELAPVETLQAIRATLLASTSPPAVVLAVDDDTQILTAIRLILEPYNIQLTCLNDPAQFWETLTHLQPDLVIVDWNMPQISGIELCQSLRQDLTWNWLPVICLTSEASPESRQQALSAGVDDYLVKPIIPAELTLCLLNRLQRVRQGKPTAPENL